MKANSLDRTSHEQVLRASVSRRAALQGLGGGVLAAALGATGATRAAAAQDASPAAVPPYLSDWATAWSTNDTALLDALYAEDAVLEDVTAGAVFQGRDAIKAHVADEHAAFPDVMFAEPAGFVSESAAATEYLFKGTYMGTLPGLPPGTGQAVALRAAVIFELAAGQVQREAHYYDAYNFLIQLGVLPAPSAQATPES